MGNKFHRKKKQKIKGTGNDFVLEEYEIYDDDLSLNRVPSIIHYKPDLIVSQVKSDPLKDYKIIKNLGQGTFGKVDLVENKISGVLRAMKVIKKGNINSKQTNEASVLNELNILKKIDHQNVVKIYEFYMDAENYYLITEYCPGGDLFEQIKNVPLSEIQVSCIIYQILLALNHIHKMKIMHRDLKPENILVTKKEKDGLYRIKICDFGTSHLFQDGEKEKLIAGSSFYIAPEVFKKKYNFKCDLWSVGVIMYVLLTKKVPFLGSTDKERKKNIIKKTYIQEPLLGHSKCIQDLIADLLEKDYDKRLNAEKALTYEIFEIFDCKNLINKIELDEIKAFINNVKKYKRHSAFQETAISYLIHHTDIEEVSQALKLYNKLDKNENGKIGFMEFYNGLCDVTGEKFDKNEVKEIFLNLDSNKNNYIEQEEFVKAAIDKKLFLSEKMIKLAFNFFDIDNSGTISVDDIFELFKENVHIGIDASSEFKKIISSIDINENGQIDYEEFHKFMKTLLEEV